VKGCERSCPTILGRYQYIADFVIEDSIIVELKTKSELTGVDEAQLLNYLKCTGHKLGLLINFGGKSLEWNRKILSLK
jgi:GxxExxY protein